MSSNYPVLYRPAPRVLRGIAAAKLYFRFFRDPLGTMLDSYRRNGPVTAVGGVLPGRKGGKLHVLALGPDCNQRILSDTSLFRATGQALAGPKDSAQHRIRCGLTKMNGEKHKTQRRIIMPSFSKKSVEGYSPEMVTICRSQVDSWPAGPEVDAWALTRKMALAQTSQILFGREDPERAGALGELLRDWLASNFSGGVWLCPVNVPGTPYRGLMRHAERIEAALRGMIADRRAADSKHSDILAVLVKAQDGECKGMTDTDLVGQANILFGASFETVAATLAWTLFLIAQHPHAAANLHDELHGTLRGEAPDARQIEQLPYLEAVIKESMRILPSVPYGIRSAAADLELDGIRLVRGDRAVISHYVTHRIPELYAEPERFRPERWFAIKPGPYEYMPFSGGPRFCIGYTFAMTSLKVALSLILQKRRPAAVAGARIDRAVRITLGPKRGIPMRFPVHDRKFESVAVRGNINVMVEMTPATPLRMASRRAA